MVPRKPHVLLLALVVGAAFPIRGQDSPLGIQGLGMPGRFESARARAMAQAARALVLARYRWESSAAAVETAWTAAATP